MSRELPLAGQQLARTDFTDTYDTERTVSADIEDANLITSMVDRGGLFAGLIEQMHRPVLDIDLPVKVLPSSTPGHFHLFIDKEMDWEKYAALLNALVEAELVEPGYRDAAFRRGYTAVRVPWVLKPFAAAAAPELPGTWEAADFTGGQR